MRRKSSVYGKYKRRPRKSTMKRKKRKARSYRQTGKYKRPYRRPKARKKYKRKSYKRKSAKRVRAGKKAWRTRKRRGAPRRAPLKRGRRLSRGIYRRYRSRGKTYYRRSRSKRSRAYRGYRLTNSIRTRNPGAKDIIIPVATAIGGLALAGVLMAKLPASITSKIPTVAGVNLGIFVPAVAGVLAMKYLTKKLPKHSKIIYGLSFGLILASGLGVYNSMIAPKLGLPGAGAMAGYVVSPFSGYVPARGAMAGYVRSKGLGQVEQSVPGEWKSMGASVEYFGNKPNMIPPSRKALNFAPLSSVPYGMGLPREERRYNDWNWSGVYNSSVYE